MGDLIDRQKAIERIVSIRPSTPKQSDYSHGVDVGMAMAIVAIKEQPSAQPERKFGEWIDNETSNADGVRQTCTCSVCGIRSYRPLGDFCRWCGADMLHENSDAGNLIPNIEPERKKGRWININDSEKYRCSECGITMWFMKSLDITPDTYIFCPHCGAEMTEGEK